MSYEVLTKNAYRNKKKAKEYQDQYIKGTKWARFTMWRQKYIIERFLNHCQIGKGDAVLDIPCGTGYLGKILSRSDGDIFAADISMEMMDLAKGEYDKSNFVGFVQSDITEIKSETKRLSGPITRGRQIVQPDLLGSNGDSPRTDFQKKRPTLPSGQPSPFRRPKLG